MRHQRNFAPFNLPHQKHTNTMTLHNTSISCMKFFAIDSLNIDHVLSLKSFSIRTWSTLLDEILRNWFIKCWPCTTAVTKILLDSNLISFCLYANVVVTTVIDCWLVNVMTFQKFPITRLAFPLVVPTDFRLELNLSTQRRTSLLPSVFFDKSKIFTVDNDPIVPWKCLMPLHKAFENIVRPCIECTVVIVVENYIKIIPN